MPRRTPPVLPRLQRELTALGDRLRQARLRRAYTAEIVAQRVGGTRKTLGRVEQGDPAVSLGVYVRVLQALGLDGDLATVARDDEVGRRLQDLNLKRPRRAPRKKVRAMTPHDLQHVEVVLDLDWLGQRLMGVLHQVRTAVATWRDEAERLALSRREQEMLSTAFSS